jgi:predicted heme/steroid binding protein
VVRSKCMSASVARGKHPHKGSVAVDGEVYLIKGFALWQMGEHIPSGGRACCGLDLTEVIDESPHGRSKLQLLKKVGNLIQRSEAIQDQGQAPEYA